MQGSQIAQYQVIEQLGSGGMGVVYKAHDTRLDRVVALKFLPSHLSMDAEAQLRFEREAKSASALDHQNICTIFEIGEYEGQTFIAMAYYDGETLQSKIEKGAITEQTAIDYAIQMAEGLSQSHAKGIVHRDIKPANVIVTSQGTVKLLDFGLAKAIERTQLTKEGATPGTIAYMSPEQTRGENIDERTDLWAIGAVLYEMLAGERPFRGVYDQAIIYGILNDEPPLLTESNPEISPIVVGIVGKLLSKRPENRYQTSQELLAALRAVRQNDPLSGGGIEMEAGGGNLRSSTSSGENVDLARSRPKWQKFAPVFVSLILLATITSLWFVISKPDSALPIAQVTESTVQSIAVLPFETLGQSEATPFSDGIHGDILTRLSDVVHLRVISRTSVRQYRNTEKTIPEIGSELGVAWLLEGDVQEAGSQVRVNVRLVDTTSDEQVWAEDYLEELTAENVFLIQGEITRQIVQALEIQLTVAETIRIDQIPTENLDAYRLFVQGQVLLNERTESGMRRSADIFQQAIDADPTYALAWVGRADALTLLNSYRYETTDSGLILAEQAIEQALSLDPELPEAYASLALLSGMRREGKRSIQQVGRAIELRPGYANAHNWLSWGQQVLGYREEALESAKRAIELDPLSPEIIGNLALSYLANNEPAKALLELQRETELQSSWTTGRFFRGLALYSLARFQEAEFELDNLDVEWARSGPKSVLAMIFLKTGDRERAQTILDEFTQSGDLFGTGLVYAAMGEKDAAFESLLKIDQWTDWMAIAIRLLFDDVWAKLADDPRYDTLYDRIDQAWNLSPVESQ